MVGRPWGRGTPSHRWWECRQLSRPWRTGWGPLGKGRLEFPQDMAIPLLGINPKRLLTFVRKDSRYAHRSMIHSGQATETTNVSYDR